MLLPLHNSSHPKIQTMQTVKTEYFFLNTWLTFLVLQNYVQYVLMFVVYPQAAYTQTSFCWFNWHPGLKDFVWKFPLTTGPKYTKIKHNILKKSIKINFHQELDFHTFWPQIASIFWRIWVVSFVQFVVVVFFSLSLQSSFPSNWFKK